MARIRTIKPEFWHDEKVGNLKRDERLLYIGLWNLADDDGVCKASPVFIKSSLFPYDDDLRINILIAWLSNLEKARMLIPFVLRDERYYVIRTFSDHQVINRPSKSRWPEGFVSNIIQGVDTNTHGVFTECSHQEEEREQGTGNGKRKAQAPPDFEKKLILVNPFSDEFLQTWILWKDYKKKEFRFLFKSLESEQASLNELVELAEGHESSAVQIIHQSMAKGWKGLFKLKDNGKNGKTVATGGRSHGANQLLESLRQDFATGRAENNGG
jgi:hypothetical protein